MNTDKNNAGDLVVSQKKFLNRLFEPGQQTCFSVDKFGTTISQAPEGNDLFFSINALSSSRADANVASYRNLLIEIDSVALNQQIELVTKAFPVTSIVYSGGKSYHFIISLTEPLATEAEYRRVWRGLFEAVPQADKSTKNPSRLSRLPGVLRPDTGLMQDLIYLGDRVPLSALPLPKPYHEPAQQPADVLFVTEQLHRVLAVGVDNYIATHFSGRNQFFYWLGRRLSELGQTRAQKQQMVAKYYERMQNKQGFGIREAYAAARVKQ